MIIKKDRRAGLFEYYMKEDNIKLFSRYRKTFMNDVNNRYVNSHYDIDKDMSDIKNAHFQHKDNLMTLDVPNDIRNNLLQIIPVKNDDIVLELGAFQGFGTLRLSQMVGKNGLVISVESNKKNFEVLEKNIFENNINNVIPVNIGVWKRKDRILLYQGGRQKNSLKKIKRKKSSHIINVDTVDNILKSLNINNVNFISLEVNRSEVDVLKGMENIINSNDNIRIVAAGWYKNDNILQSTTIKNVLENYNFNVYIGPMNRVYAIKGY